MQYGIGELARRRLIGFKPKSQFRNFSAPAGKRN